MSDDTLSAPANVSPGDKVAGYRLEEQIGQGGMAVVFRARDERLDRRVALKLLAPGLAADSAFRTRFIRESRAAAAVDHPNIIPVYDAGDAGGFLFIAMRYVQGGDVRSLFADGRGLPAARAWNIISQVGAALDAAHEHNLIHRDVKPANILLDKGGGVTGARRGDANNEQREHVYLSDFGISKQSVASHLTSTGQFVGTLDYIPPEQIEGRTLDGRADQYSLACAAFELLTGEPPFRRQLGLALINAHLAEPAPSLAARRPDLPADADRVIAKALAKSPQQRYETCTDFAMELGRALGLVPVQSQAAVPTVHQHQPQPLAPQPVVGQAPVAQPVTPQPIPAATFPTRGPPGQYPQYAQPYSPHPQYGQPGAGGMPGGPGWQQPPPPKRSRSLLIAVIAATVVIAAAAVGISVALLGSRHGGNPGAQGSSTGSNSNSPAATQAAKSEATAINTLLSNSATTRLAWNSNLLVSDVGKCINIGNDVQQIQAIANERASEYNQALALQTGAIPNGASVRSELIAALLISRNIDNEYLKWALQQQSSGCSAGLNSNYYTAATSQDSVATNDKTTFVNTWNPIAQRYGLQQFSAGQI